MLPVHVHHHPGAAPAALRPVVISQSRLEQVESGLLASQSLGRSDAKPIAGEDGAQALPRQIKVPVINTLRLFW